MNSTYFKRLEENKVIVVDLGQNSATHYNALTEEVTSISHRDVLNLPSKYNGYLFISEDAHLGTPQRGKSLAQSFSEKDILKFLTLCKENNNLVYFFPQKLTYRALLYSGMEKSDKNDPIAVYKFLKNHPETTLKNPPSSFELSKARLEGYRFLKDCNLKNNLTRAGDGKGTIYKGDPISSYVFSHLNELEKLLSEEAKFAFGLTWKNAKGEFKPSKYDGKRYGKKNGTWQSDKIKMNQLCAIISPMKGVIAFDPKTETYKFTDGLDKREGTGEIPSWKFSKKYVFRFSPFHQNGGVARSNLVYHGLKNYATREAKKEGFNFKRKVDVLDTKTKKIKKATMSMGHFTPQELASYKKHRSNYCRYIKEAYNVFRNLLLQKEEV